MIINLKIEVNGVDESLVSATNIVTAIKDGIDMNAPEGVETDIVSAEATIVQNYTILPMSESVEDIQE